VLYVQGGLHGDELIGVEAARRVAGRVRPEELRGTLVCVPIANPPALISGQRGWPAEARGPVDMNRVCPGDPKGPLTARLAHALFDGILRRADYCIDLHGGISGSLEAPFAQVVMLDDDHGTLAKRRRMAEAFGTELIYEMHAKERGRHVVFNGLELSFAEQARLAGVPTLVVELGEGGRLDERLVSFAVQGILNVMASLRMIRLTPLVPSRRFLFRTVAILRPEHGGTLTLRVRPGEWVKKGAPIGAVADGLRVVEKLSAPATGVVQRVATLGRTEPGADILWVAEAQASSKSRLADG
jgi:predicted deacylase